MVARIDFKIYSWYLSGNCLIINALTCNVIVIGSVIGRYSVSLLQPIVAGIALLYKAIKASQKLVYTYSSFSFGRRSDDSTYQFRFSISFNNIIAFHCLDTYSWDSQVLIWRVIFKIGLQYNHPSNFMMWNYKVSDNHDFSRFLLLSAIMYNY